MSGTNEVSDGNETNNPNEVSDGNETNNPHEVSEENAVTDETPQPHEPHIRILKGRPTDQELAALIAALASVSGAPEPAQPESTRWGLPADRLRYAISNYQRLTLQERMHMQR